MKKHHAWILYTLLGAAGVEAAERRGAEAKVAGPDLAARTASLETDKPRIIERWPDGRVWERVTTRTLTNGQTVLHTNRWVDLASGMHFWDKNHWKETRANIVITDEGAEAKEGPHKVRFAGNINTVSAISITGADDVTLRAQVVGLAYTDLSTGESVLLATVQNSVGELLPLNQVVYPEAFAGLRADLRYTYTKQSFEQDVILRENPPAPSTFGLNDQSTVLEVWTEFDAPEPQRRPVPSNGLPDETLSFGRLRITRGVAFALDNPAPRHTGAPVGKTWLSVQGRQYLIESVPLRAVERELKKLPLRAALPSAPAGNQPTLRAAAPTAPKPRLAWLQRMEPRRAAAPTPVRLALDDSLVKRAPGLVLDWVIHGGDTNSFTFQTDTTYLISDGFSIMDKAILEGGTVIKVGITNPTTIQFFGELEVRADPYRPVIMTSQNDTSVGLDFTAPGSSGKYHGAIAVAQEHLSLSHLRISHAQYGLQTYGLTLSDAQFTHCDRAFYSHNYPIEVNNVLFHKVGRVFAGTAYSASASHITVNECAQLSDDYDDPEYSQVAITNSLLINVTNLGVVSLTTNFTVVTTNNPFQTVGAGAHYLADPSPYRDAGTTNIPATLAARLKKTTTYPPLVIDPPGGFYGVSQTFFPRAARDLDLPDLGYHYNPLDYALARVYLTNATFTVEPGTAIGFFNPTNISGYGLWLNQDARLIANGKADAKVHLTQYATVQEMENTSWNGPLDYFIYSTAPSTGSQELRCRFTDFTTLTRSDPTSNLLGAVNFIYALERSASVALTDCQFHGGLLSIFTESLVHATNSLFNRNYNSWYLLSDATNWFFNNTFQGGTLEAFTWTPEQLRLHDSLFVGTAIIAGDAVSSHIGYVGASRLNPTNSNDQVLTNLLFQTGPLGHFYVPTNTALFNNGGRNATNAGLYHFTMLTNSVKETNTTVDIGFHYAATDANGTPLDYDGDGVPDYWEDWNGNGGVDSGETDWLNASDPGLKIFITRPRQNSAIP
jgi:hypothetical protein